MPRDDATLLDIRAAGRRALEFAEGLTREGFEADLKTQSAVLHQLLVLGEAVRRLSEDFRISHPEVPWRLIAGMRNHLIHGYDAVDREEVWNAITRDIPTLLRDLEPLMPQDS